MVSKQEVWELVTSLSPDYKNNQRIDPNALIRALKERYGCALSKKNMKDLWLFASSSGNPELFISFLGRLIETTGGKLNVSTNNVAETKQEPEHPKSTSKTITKEKTHKTMNIDKNKLEYVVGIDLGHGETSAAICPLQWDIPTEQLDAVKDLDMGGNKKVIPSAITILDDGNAYIGDKAFRPDFLKRASVNVCFKKAPTDMQGDAEQLMMRFMKEVYLTIRENNPAILQDGNHLVYIATPSGWDKKTMDMYAEMARQAGIPLGGITKESRAAFVRAQQDQTSGLGRNITKGAIVFDMGSSTLDFTYLNLSKGDNLIDHGYDCGASFIEKFIFKKAEERADIIRSFEEKYPKLVSRALKKSQHFGIPIVNVQKNASPGSISGVWRFFVLAIIYVSQMRLYAP